DLRVPRMLHSFPTRRSSDLLGAPRAERGETAAGHDERGEALPDLLRKGRAASDGRQISEERGLHMHVFHGAKGLRVVVVAVPRRSEEHTSELQSLAYLVCRL